MSLSAIKKKIAKQREKKTIIRIYLLGKSPLIVPVAIHPGTASFNPPSA